MESVKQVANIGPIPAKHHGMENGQVALPAKHQASNFLAVGSCLQTEGPYSEIRMIPRHIAHQTNLMDLHFSLS
jgi:hypothetical protein